MGFVTKSCSFLEYVVLPESDVWRWGRRERGQRGRWSTLNQIASHRRKCRWRLSQSSNSGSLEGSHCGPPQCFHLELKFRKWEKILDYGNILLQYSGVALTRWTHCSLMSISFTNVSCWYIEVCCWTTVPPVSIKGSWSPHHYPLCSLSIIFIPQSTVSIPSNHFASSAALLVRPPVSRYGILQTLHPPLFVSLAA